MDNATGQAPTDGAEEGEIPSEDFVSIPRAELDALRARAAEAAVSPSREAPDQEPPPDAGRDAEAARALAARDLRVAELERTCKAAVRDRELATSLAGRPLVAGAAGQLIKLWRDEFDAYEEGGTFKVAGRDGRAVAQVVDDWLSSPEYAHFCLPPSKGGTGARDANRPAGAGGPSPAPRNLGESIVNRWREELAARPDSLLKPVGLRRRRST